jgi:hypothetical protein
MGRSNRHADGLRGEYLALSIIASASRPQRLTPLMAAGGLIALGAVLLFVLWQ